jgi:hypothetical protein
MLVRISAGPWYPRRRRNDAPKMEAPA